MIWPTQCSEVLTSFDQKCMKTFDQKWMKATVNLSKVTKFWPQFDQTGVQSKKWIQLYQSSNSIYISIQNEKKNK